MKTKEIKEFYKESNNFLRKNQSMEMIGIPYLSPHFPRSIIVRKKRNSNFLFKVIRHFLRSIFFKKNFVSLSNNKFKYLILSHFVSYNHLDYSNDFYYGKLGKKLGYKNVLFVLIDHVGIDKNIIKKKIRGNYIILSRKINLFAEISMLIRTSFKIYFKSLTNDRLRLLSMNNILGSIDNQRITLQVKKILKSYDLKKFFFTFEGNPYEKLVCREARKINKNLQIIGYQFGVLRKFQNSIYSFLNKIFEPNIICTVGNYNKNLLVSKFRDRLTIYNFGLFKKEKVKAKFKKKINKNEKIKILVMPEGIPSEIEILLNYCLKNQNKEVEYNFRLHPIFLNNKFIYEKIKREGKNIKISKNKLNDDIKNNKFLLYRGTASVIDGVKSGLIPIYLNEKDQVSVDPLFKVNKRHIVSCEINLLNFIKKNLKNEKQKKELIKIKKFTNSFYGRPNFSKLMKVLNIY